jgi:hypothetical protein
LDELLILCLEKLLNDKHKLKYLVINFIMVYWLLAAVRAKMWEQCAALMRVQASSELGPSLV